MADVLNLNRFRKQRKKQEQQETAVRNRSLHGRTKAERLGERLRRERAERDLRGKRLDDPNPGEG